LHPGKEFYQRAAEGVELPVAGAGAGSGFAVSGEDGSSSELTPEKERRKPRDLRRAKCMSSSWHELRELRSSDCSRHASPAAFLVISRLASDFHEFLIVMALIIFQMHEPDP
jgi:hypothetical protein